MTFCVVGEKMPPLLSWLPWFDDVPNPMQVQPVETVAMRPVSPVQPPKSLVGRHRAFVDDTAPDPFVSQGPSRETTRRARRIGHDISQ